MYLYLRTYLLLAFLLASSSTPALAMTEPISEDCGDIQHNVENGMIRLPVFSPDSIKDINCSWTYIAPAGRKLLVKVDSVHLPSSDVRFSLFQLYVDDVLYDIPRNCVKCLRETLGGKTIRVLFSSSSALLSTESPQNSSSDSSASAAEGIGSFQVRYKSFDPHRCGKPDPIENGHIIAKGRKVGQSIFYRCNPPYDILGESEVHCVIPPSSPVPEWNNKGPKCVIPECDNGPILRNTSAGSIASPGYPTYDYQFATPCEWIVTTHPNQQIKASITYLKLPKQQDYTLSQNSSRLSLIDGDYTYIVNLTHSLTNGPLNFTILSNKLIVEFVVNNEDNKRKEETGFYLEYSAISSSCPKLSAPKNGEIIAYGNEMGSVVSYSCDKGFVLVGEHHAECLPNGQWSHPSPACESLTEEAPISISASNDTDIVTSKFAELPTDLGPVASPVPSKPSRKGKKKIKESTLLNPLPNLFPAEEKYAEEDRNQAAALDESEKASESKNDKKHAKENGPKSEPHLFQVIPPKDTGKKATEDSAKKAINSTKLEDFDDELDEERTTKRHPLMTVTMISIIAGVGAPLVVAVIFLIAIVVYRRRYPVRMRFGRKFSTFENPMYVTKDAHHPRELKRLTT